MKVDESGKESKRRKRKTTERKIAREKKDRQIGDEGNREA